MKLHTGVQRSYFQVGYSLPIQQHLPTELQNALAAGSSTGDGAHTLTQAPSINYQLNDTNNDPNSDGVFHPKLKIHPFTTHPYVLMEALVISNLPNRSGVSQKDQIPP